MNERGESGTPGFDPVAEGYDREMHRNPAMQYMRRVSLGHLRRVFRPGQRVLEVGCGTGEEALALAQGGVRVLATDIAPAMLAVTAHKVAEANLQEVVHTHRLAARDLHSLLSVHGRGAFDGAYSSFGPLNGEPELAVVAEALGALVKPGGHLVVSVMNRYYLLETCWYLLHGAGREAVRRWRGTTWASVSADSAATMRTWYYTPGGFARALAPWFRRLHCQALPLLLPPPYLAHLWTRHPALWRRLRPLEDTLVGRWPFHSLGDHFLMVLRRSEPGERG